MKTLLSALTLALVTAVMTPAWADARTVLTTGSNAGHGLAFVEEYPALGWNVIATCRTPEKADRLKVLAGQYPGIVIEELDIVDGAFQLSQHDQGGTAGAAIGHRRHDCTD